MESKDLFKDSKFKHGQTLKSKINGYKGVVTVVSKSFTGVFNYRIESTKLKSDGTMIDSIGIDETEAELIDKKIRTNPVAPVSEFKYDFDDEVKHKHLEVKGIITGLSLMGTGCLYYTVQSKEIRKVLKKNTVFESEEKLVLVKASEVKHVPPKTGGIAVDTEILS